MKFKKVVAQVLLELTMLLCPLRQRLLEKINTHCLHLLDVEISSAV